MEIKDLSDISYLLPPMTKTTDFDSLDSVTEDSALMLDYMVLAMEYQRSMKREDYAKAADCATQLIELLKQHPVSFEYRGEQFTSLHEQRAHAYVMAKDYNAALSDLEWVQQHASISVGKKAQVTEGIIHLLQGNNSTVLRDQAAKGNLLAMLLANQPENLEPPKTDWMLLTREERIQKLVEGRHYESVIEEIDRMNIQPWDWNNRVQNDKWLALKGVCYALRGNHTQAISNLKDRGFFENFNPELAVVYTMAGEKERAEKALEKQFDPGIQIALIRQWMETI
jgi:hypothetical protein